jgi:hypothetical protein
MCTTFMMATATGRTGRDTPVPNRRKQGELRDVVPVNDPARRQGRG